MNNLKIYCLFTRGTSLSDEAVGYLFDAAQAVLRGKKRGKGMAEFSEEEAKGKVYTEFRYEFVNSFVSGFHFQGVIEIEEGKTEVAFLVKRCDKPARELAIGKIPLPMPLFSENPVWN